MRSGASTPPALVECKVLIIATTAASPQIRSHETTLLPWIFEQAQRYPPNDSLRIVDKEQHEKIQALHAVDA